MFKAVIHQEVVLLYGTHMNAHGLSEEEIIEGCPRNTMDELSDHCMKADIQFLRI